MARVIVILTLLSLITAGIFLLARPGASPGKTTVALSAPADVAGPAVASAQDVVGGAMAGAAPTLATAGMDARGRASLTGTAAPGDRLAVLKGERVLGRGQADSAGNWNISFRMPEADDRFELRVRSQRARGESVEGPQRVEVLPPDGKGGLPVVRIAAAATPATTAEVPFTSPGSEPGTEPNVGIIIETVDADDKGRVSLAGRADPGATVRLDMGRTSAGSTRVGRDGRWRLDARNTTGKEVKMVRISLVSARGRQIDASTLPLRLPAPTVLAPANGTNVDRSRATAAGSPRWIKVRRGDSLWKLARRHYGDGSRWTRILKANRRRIADPDLILPGLRLRLP